MTPELCLTIYCVIIVGSSLLGGWLPTVFQLSHLKMQLVLSGVGGLMLSIGLLHLLPHSVVETNSLDTTMIWVLVGLLATFFLIRLFHFHVHAEDAAHSDCHGHTHDHAHGHEHEPVGSKRDSAGDSAKGGGASWGLNVIQPSSGSTQAVPLAKGAAGSAGSEGRGAALGELGGNQLRWVPVMFGLSLHTLIDGVALAAAVASDVPHGGPWPWGIGVFLAIVAHKWLDSLSVTSLMKSQGWSLGACQGVNLGFSLMCPLGAVLVWLGLDISSSATGWWLGVCLAFAAGSFLCISLSDLLPELQFHTHDRVPLSISLLCGVVVALLIGLAEREHAHDISGHDHGETAEHGSH